jgi:hypothetical protein
MRGKDVVRDKVWELSNIEWIAMTIVREENGLA